MEPEVRIAVVTAVRNGIRTLPALFDSLKRQTSREFEWIVQDGGSDDGTREWLERVSLEEPWVKLRSERDGGLYDALNRAIARASADYYVTVGADDLLTQDAIERYTRATHAGGDVFLAQVRRGGRVIGGFHPRRRWLGHAQVFRGSHSVGMLFRRALHDRLGTYSLRFPVLADGYFLKRLLDDPAVRFVELPFVAGEFAEGGVSGSVVRTAAETWQIQMLTEPSPLLQTALFFAKLLVRWPAVRRDSVAGR